MRYLMPTSMVVLFVLMASLAGCSDARDPHGRHALSGAVTFQGKPLDQGSIRFQALEDNGLSAGALIQNGKYQIPREQGLPPGTYKVNVSSLEPTPPLTGAPGENPAPPAKERLPEEYNLKTRQKVVIKDGQESRFDFDIK